MLGMIKMLVTVKVGWYISKNNFCFKILILNGVHLTGMSDLCSPMIMLFEHEADAFWCFERLMRRLVGFFFFFKRIHIV